MNETPADAMQLKPCPFCGEHELPPIMPKTEYGELSCVGCGARGPMREYSGQRADPVERWNTRTTSLAAQDGLVDALRALVDEQCDYMRINNLGDPEEKHNIKRARAALAALGE